MVPEVPTVMLLEKLALELVEISNPVGAVTLIPVVMFAPDTVKLVAADGVPVVLLNVPRVSSTEMVGGGALAATENPTTPLELIVMVPSYTLVRLGSGSPFSSTPLIVPVGSSVQSIR